MIIYNEYKMPNYYPTTINYGMMTTDTDEDGNHVFQQNYNVICFSTRDHCSTSLPYLYFIPTHITLPDFAKSGNLSKTFTYTGELDKWLTTNAEYVLKCQSHMIATSF